MGGRLLHVLYYSILYHIIPYDQVLMYYIVVLYFNLLYGIIQYDQVLQCIILCYTISYYTILYYIIQFFTVISYTIMYSVPFGDGMATSIACATHR